MAEPQWTRYFTNDNVCNYFYYLSLVFLIGGSLMVLLFAYGISVAPKSLTSMLVVGLIGQLVGVGLSYFVYLFAYLTCSRSLIDNKESL